MAQKKRVWKSQKTFNGKPMSHWNAMADELVVDLIVRAALQHTDTRSIVGSKAATRLLKIAEAENPVLYKKVLKERAACQLGMAKLLSEILG